MTAAGIDRVDADRAEPVLGQHPHQAAVLQRVLGDEVRLQDDAHAGDGGLAQHVAAVGAQPALHAHPCLAVGAVQGDLVQRHVAVGQEFVAGDVGSQARRAGALQVGRRGVQSGLHLAELARDQGRGDLAGDADRHVVAFLDDVHHAIGQRQVQRDLRIARAVAGQARPQPGDAEAEGRVDAQRAGRSQRLLADRRLHVVELGQQHLAALVIRGADAARADPAGGAVEQAQAQPLLQPGHLPGDAGGGHAQRLGGAVEAVAVDHGDEHAHRFQRIHCCRS